MKRYTLWITNGDADMRPDDDGAWCPASETDAELKRRDEEIAELKLRIFVAGKFIKEKYTEAVDLKNDLQWLFDMDASKLNSYLKKNPQYVPRGNGEKS